MRITWAAWAGLCAWVVTAQAQEVDMGATLPPGSPRAYYKAVREYFHVSERQVIVIVKQWRHFGDLPVVLFIAARSGTPVEQIVAARRRGREWLDIARQNKLSAADFYFPVTEVVGAPFHAVYEMFAGVEEPAWSRVNLRDEDIVNLVNLRFLTEHHRCAPQAVMKLRAAGKQYDEIERELGERKTSE